jgi:hypothetical protein
MSLSALANAGVLSFMVLLVVLLAMSLSAIIGLPACPPARLRRTAGLRLPTGRLRRPVPGRRDRGPAPTPRGNPARAVIRPGMSPARCPGRSRSPGRKCPAIRPGDLRWSQGRRRRPAGRRGNRRRNRQAAGPDDAPAHGLDGWRGTRPGWARDGPGRRASQTTRVIPSYRADSPGGRTCWWRPSRGKAKGKVIQRHRSRVDTEQPSPA